MRLERVSVTEIEMNGFASSSGATDIGLHCRRSREFDWQFIPFLAVTVGLAVYGYYLAWESWKQLVRLVASPHAEHLTAVGLAIQVVAPLLPPLSLVTTYLSWRRDGPWFFRTGALCLLGLLTTAVELLGNVLR